MLKSMDKLKIVLFSDYLVMLFQKPLKTSLPSALVKKELVNQASHSTIKDPNSTESFLASWPKVVTSHLVMAVVVNLFTV